MSTHDESLARAFDGQAEQFERSKAVSDAAALARFVEFAALPPGARVIDAGCGPGLVAEAFLEAGCEVFGADLSAEMVRRARQRCARFGGRARFEQRSIFEVDARDFDAAVSRYVLHHVEDPPAFIRRQAGLIRPGGIVLALDSSGDPDPARHEWSQRIERERDRTHVRTLTPGELVDAFAAAGLVDLQLKEDELDLDFDGWFDRGTPSAPKEEVRARFLAGQSRGFAPRRRPDGGLDLHLHRAAVRGIRPETA
ncbi:MAG TPA: class I SAM-dependent methyltransferase [Myxococcaceae bacterium]|nr:class I SAM-dependent methyltransferase [Myxococcaceae bacterium]